MVYINFVFDDNTKRDIEGTQGQYFPYSKTIHIYINRCYSPHDIFDTIEHEVLHHVLFPFDLDEEEEHSIIDGFSWVKLFF